jgi:opacity protein-like surface antigen
MNTSKDWEGGVLDLYNYGGTLEYYNNLGFDLKLSKQFTDMINNMSNTKIIKNTNNKYFESASEAVVDLESFASKYSGIGANR